MTSRLIPWMFVAGMALVVAVNGTLIYFATSTWSGLTVERPYEKGLVYNRAIAAAARQEALGWHFTVRLASQGDASEVTVAAVDRGGQPIEGLRVEATLERPVEPGRSPPVALQPQGPGRYVARIERLRPGQWETHLAVSRGADHAAFTHREVVR